jgi:adenosylhomocysteine nucleosidase
MLVDISTRVVDISTILTVATGNHSIAHRLTRCFNGTDMIAILVAVNQELNPILRRASANHLVRQAHLDFYEGTLAGQSVALLALGVGKECARIAAEMTIKSYRPDLVISAGFGGALHPSVNDGDLVIGTEALDLNKDSGAQVRWNSTLKLTPREDLSMDNNNCKIHRGKILTTDDIIIRAATKQHLGRATGALAADMETSAVAAVCAAHSTEMLAVRCITDNDHEDLPEDLDDFFMLGQLQWGRLLSACNRHPRLILDLARLGHRASIAGENLARFLETAMRQLHLPAAAAGDLQ